MTDFTINPTIVQAVRDHLDEIGFTYRYNDDTGVFSFGMTIGGEISKIDVFIDVYDTWFKVIARPPLRANTDDPRTMNRITEFLHRANYGLNFGNFEFDYSDGEIRYKVPSIIEDMTPTPGLIRECILRAVSCVRQYGSGILCMLYGSVSPEAAAEACDNGEPIPAPNTDGEDDESFDESSANF